MKRLFTAILLISFCSGICQTRTLHANNNPVISFLDTQINQDQDSLKIEVKDPGSYLEKVEVFALKGDPITRYSTFFDLKPKKDRIPLDKIPSGEYVVNVICVNQRVRYYALYRLELEN